MPDKNIIEPRWLGRINYEEALALQESLVRDRIPAIENQLQRMQSNGQAFKTKNKNPDLLLLLEHEPVYTMGRTPDQSSLRNPEQLPHPVVRINRGGQATYHGPGQLVGYPIMDLKIRCQDLHRYLRAIEEILITVLRNEYGITAERRDGLTGVWVGGKKIASIGVGVRHWITMHGFALNVCGDLSPFQHITPCGIANVEMTSVERECGRSVSVREVADCVAAILPEQMEVLLPSTNCSGGL